MRYRYYIEKMQQTFSVVGKNSKERTYNVYACKSAMYCLRCPISRWMPGNPGEARGEFVVWHSSCSKSILLQLYNMPPVRPLPEE